MTITAEVVADTQWPKENGTRITTLLLRYPRFIHAEFMTHRMFSRNASSSRAIPVQRLIDDVIRDPVDPSFWGKNQPGMQAKEALQGVARNAAINAWYVARRVAIEQAQAMADIGAHKQIVNRLLEPFSHINVVVTATEWANFFYLRDHPDAQPEIRILAQVMKTAMLGSTPRHGVEHLPFILEEERLNAEYTIAELAQVSAARAARTSYLTHEGKKPDWEEDLRLAAKLDNEPPHLSPFEHQARWMGGGNPGQPAFHANFRHWRSARYCMERGFSF